jgi:biopolymer transport protein ExbD
MASNNNDDYEITGINVTPFVDIMLVLLVIFMVTATFIVKEAIEVELPKAASAGESTNKTLAIVITKENKTFLDGIETTDDALLNKLTELKQTQQDIQAIIGADTDASHGAVVHILDILKSHGIIKFAIQIEKKA